MDHLSPDRNIEKVTEQEDIKRHTIWVKLICTSLLILFVLVGALGNASRSHVTNGVVQRMSVAIPQNDLGSLNSPQPTVWLTSVSKPIQSTDDLNDEESRSTLYQINRDDTILNSSNVRAIKINDNAAIQIDGNIEDWPRVQRYSSNWRTNTPADTQTSDELKATWQFLWDESYLYIAVHVQDDVHAQTKPDALAYCGDSLELAIDTDFLSMDTNRLDRSHSVLLISPGNFAEIEPSVFQYIGTPDQNKLIPYLNLSQQFMDVEVDTLKVDDGYLIESKISWEAIGASPISNLQTGFVLNVIDNDEVGKAVNGVVYSNMPDRIYTQPNSWGTLKLEE